LACHSAVRGFPLAHQKVMSMVLSKAEKWVFDGVLCMVTLWVMRGRSKDEGYQSTIDRE